MTELYKEALLEARKLKEKAQEEAIAAVVEALTPSIKNVISKQISEASKDDFLFNEQEEATDKNINDVSGLSLSAGPMGNEMAAAPLQPSSGQDIVNAAMPGSDGLLTINVEDLFVGDPTVLDSNEQQPTLDPVSNVSMDEIQPIEMETMSSPDEQPVAATEVVPPKNVLAENISFESWKKEFLETSEKIDKVFFAKKIPNIVKESLKTKLFLLLETLDSLKENGKISREQKKINENKLEFLFLKLKDNDLNNSYIEKDQKEDKNMASLKEYAAKLFAESVEVDDDINQETTASGKHAASVSGVATGVELKEEMLSGTDASPGEEKQWADGEPSLEEKDQDKVIEEALAAIAEEVEAEGSAGFGDTNEKPVVEPMLEIDEKELKEAIMQIKKEALKKRLAKLKEGVKEGDQGSEKPAGGADPALKNLTKKPNPSKSGLKEVPELTMSEETDLMNVDDSLDFSDDSEEDELDVDGDLVLNIDLPDDVEDALKDVDLSSLEGIRVSLADVNLGSDEELEVLTDDEETEDSEDMSMMGDNEPEEEVEVDDEEEVEVDDEEEKSLMFESSKRLSHRNKLLETKLTQVAKVATNLKNESTELKAELKEANLFIAKNVYFTKFLQRGDLSKTNLTKIVEYLDRAKTVQEAKDIYTKIKNKLTESAATSVKLSGSASKATSSGSAVSLNESVNNEDELVIDSSRWQKLANIKTNDK